MESVDAAAPPSRATGALQQMANWRLPLQQEDDCRSSFNANKGVVGNDRHARSGSQAAHVDGGKTGALFRDARARDRLLLRQKLSGMRP